MGPFPDRTSKLLAGAPHAWMSPLPAPPSSKSPRQSFHTVEKKNTKVFFFHRYLLVTIFVKNRASDFEIISFLWKNKLY